MSGGPERVPKFEDIAIALVLAATKLRLDLEQLEYITAKIDLSPMGTAIAVAEMRRNIDLIAHAHAFFKDNAPAEQEIRTVAARKRNGRWPFNLMAAAG